MKDGHRQHTIILIVLFFNMTFYVYFLSKIENNLYNLIFNKWLNKFSC